MSGYTTDGLPQLSFLTGSEQAAFDTEVGAGLYPESGAVNLIQLAVMANFIINTTAAGKTMVAGTRYYTGVTLGAPALLTGIAFLVGGTGGTDNWYAELHDVNGNGLTQSAATVAGTASLWQKIPFTAQYQAPAGNYFLTLISNGATAKFATYNSAGLPLLTGSTSGGTAGTLAGFTPPTTYTANVGPIAMPYQ